MSVPAAASTAVVFSHAGTVEAEGAGARSQRQTVGIRCGVERRRSTARERRFLRRLAERRAAAAR